MKIKKKLMGRVVLFTTLLLSLSAHTGIKAEEFSTNKLAILTSTDKTGLGLAQTLKENLGNLMANTNLFQTYYADYSLSGFDEASILSDFKKVGADLMSYVYLEKSRLSLFLFDSSHPQEFIVSAQPFTTSEGENLSTAEIQAGLNKAFQEVISSYVAKEYQSLPGSQAESNYLTQGDYDPSRFALSDVRKLYREIAATTNTGPYFGANVGMSRFETVSTTASAQKTYASTVNVGAVLGYQFIPALSAELGADLFTHLLLHGELRSEIPLGQKYLSVTLSLGAARFMTQPTQNLGYGGTNNIAQGTVVYGPGIGIGIPLLGLNIRAEGRYYFGPTTVFLGTYGIVFAL